MFALSFSWKITRPGIIAQKAQWNRFTPRAQFQFASHSCNNGLTHSHVCSCTHRHLPINCHHVGLYIQSSPRYFLLNCIIVNFRKRIWVCKKIVTFFLKIFNKIENCSILNCYFLYRNTTYYLNLNLAIKLWRKIYLLTWN